ncbi:protein UNUSUAL FLORAL ORGANS [Cryptomeria japonica]|uniref:protein UNUSUAL FLORAL ORGANS n=1 Tax=Cryptomeria japonica TaxID=3369 RepID=UPI0025AD86C6|nr:protein UNUSUAL FLORAL ORGANS [Cryptomeria japonica]
MEVEMEDAIWRRLPEKLIERVVAMLPVVSFMRLRAVCKHWYGLMFSDSFLEVCREVRQGRPCFLLFKMGVWTQGFLYDPSSQERSWLRMSLPFIPPGFTVAASSGGLLCCVPDQPGCKTIFLCNPLTQSFSLLPSTLKERFVPSVGLLVDGHTQSYKLVVAGDDLISPFAVKNLSTEVLDSACPEWKMSGALPRLCSLESGKMTYSDGFFYCMNYSPFSVLAYDIRRGVWSKIEAPMRRFLRAPSLVECRGRLVLVAAVRKSKLNVPKSIRMWGLHHSRNGWVELERMPQTLYDQFITLSDEDSFSCIAHGNLILITMTKSPEMLMYDFYDKIWSWVPHCPFVDRGEGLQGFPFDPRLEASPTAMEKRSALAPSISNF